LANILFGNCIISEASFNKWNQIENKNETPKNLSNKTEKKFNNSNKKTSNTEAKVISLILNDFLNWLYNHSNLLSIYF